MNNNPAPQQRMETRQVQNHLKLDMLNLAINLRGIKTIYCKSVDPDSMTQSCRWAILKSCMRTA